MVFKWFAWFCLILTNKESKPKVFSWLLEGFSAIKVFLLQWLFNGSLNGLDGVFLVGL